MTLSVGTGTELVPVVVCFGVCSGLEFLRRIGFQGGGRIGRSVQSKRPRLTVWGGLPAAIVPACMGGCLMTLQVRAAEHCEWYLVTLVSLWWFISQQVLCALCGARDLVC